MVAKTRISARLSLDAWSSLTSAAAQSTRVVTGYVGSTETRT